MTFCCRPLLSASSADACVEPYISKWKKPGHKYEARLSAGLVRPVSNTHGSLAYIEWDGFGATIPCGPRLHYLTFLDPCLAREWISCTNWVIAPSNLYTAYWMAVAAMSSVLACRACLIPVTSALTNTHSHSHTHTPIHKETHTHRLQLGWKYQQVHS